MTNPDKFELGQRDGSQTKRMRFSPIFGEMQIFDHTKLVISLRLVVYDVMLNKIDLENRL